MAPKAANPPGRGYPGASTATLSAIVLGWVLVRLVTVGGGNPPATGGKRPGLPKTSPGSEDEAGSASPLEAAGQGDRGRHADQPTEIPARGWKDVLWRVYERFNRDRVLSIAAGITFYTLLSIFPATAAFVSLYGLFADASTVQNHLNSLAGVLPGGALEIIGDQIKRITSKGNATLGFSFFVGLATALWSANAGMKAVFDALNIVYQEDEKRSFIGLNLRSLAFTIGTIVFLMLALGAVVVLPIVLEFVGLGKVAEWLLWILRWPALLAGVMLVLALIYRYGPSRDSAQWKWTTPGSVVAAVLWLVGSMLFSWYVSSFGNYNETYGSLGAAIGFMTWIWISSIIVLLGAEINAETEHQTVKDTTEGPKQPLGTRGAAMADTVGEAKA